MKHLAIVSTLVRMPPTGPNLVGLVSADAPLRLAAGDNKSLQVCFRLGVKKIRSSPCISTGYGSRLVARTGVSRDALLVAVTGAVGENIIVARCFPKIHFNIILNEQVDRELTSLTRIQKVGLSDSIPAEASALSVRDFTHSLQANAWIAH
jgi:hypothetical protein